MECQRRGEMPVLGALTRDQPMLGSVANLLDGSGVSLAELRETLQVQTTGRTNEKDYFVTFSPLKFNGWVVATVTPADDFLASMRRNVVILQSHGCNSQRRRPPIGNPH
jgi:hypothetical protein